MDYGLAKMDQGECLSPRQLTPREQLIARRERVAEELKRIDSAIAAFDLHPEVEQVMTLYAQALMR